MLQQNVTRESISRENVRNCVKIFVVCTSMVLGLGLVGGTTTYMIHLYETKNFIPAVGVTLGVVTAFIWILIDTYYSRTPPDERPCRFLRPPVSYAAPVPHQAPVREPLIDNVEEADDDAKEDSETAEM